MPRLSQLLNPAAYVRVARRYVEETRRRLDPNRRGATFFPPGHFYSPLLDITTFPPTADALPFDGPEYWECVDLRPADQRAYYADLLADHPPPAFPATKTPGFRYYVENEMFAFFDAFTLAGVIRKEKPGRIVEVGSGFSSAVMLDTLDHARQAADLTCIEPYPDRLYSLLTPADRDRVRILPTAVQEVPLATFDALGPGDVLFIDSSHVAKIGSDVTHLFLRVLPRLRAGVLVHVHDIFYPPSYPATWVREGRAWNESLFLRAFLAGNPDYRVVAFNAFAGHTFPELFLNAPRPFRPAPAGSIWLRKVSGGSAA